MYTKAFFFKIFISMLKSPVSYFILGISLFLPLHADEVSELISEGTACNNFFLYEDALEYLGEAIKIRPTEKEAYMERALSYFELNNIDLALEDYHRVVKIKLPYRIDRASFYTSESSSWLNSTFSSLDFARGLLHGTLMGGKEETIEFVSSIRGGLSFLWAFACAPSDVSKELIDAVYAMGEFLTYAKVYDLLEVALPELMECRQYWDVWSDYMKGQKMGFIIGKYSIAAFYYVTVWKGASVYNQLRRANTMAILRRCSLSQGTKILETSAKQAPRNALILKKAFNGSVIPHNPNVVPHVMQKKHRWDKYVHLTGNQSEDFKKVTAFLEEIEILKCDRELDFSFKSVKSYYYRKNIGNDTIVTMFDVNKNNCPLLKNAWVETKPPYVP